VASRSTPGSGQPLDRRPLDRAASLRRLADEQFDVLVVGGGITGAGVALDAATRGLRTALVERDDFASGTSSKSSKLVHGGLRYLQQREVRLVYEALYERQRALENAPHLVRILPFLVPMLTRGGVIDRRLARLLGSALWMYDLTGGVRIGKRHHRVDVETALAHMPSLARDHVAGAYVYYDAQTDDARLTLTIARTAVLHGAAIANHAAVRGLLKDGDRVVGARVDADGAEIEVRARVVVNAAGVWSDDVRALDEGVHPASIRPAKGIHIALPWEKVRNDIAAIIPVPGDKRMLFVVPWGDTTYVGTTDTDYDGPLDDPPCTPADVDYLLAALNGISEEKLTADDVVGTWAGLRPLLRTGRSTRTSDLSRRHTVRVAPSGVVTVTGGKLTTYRRMAADAVDAALDVLDGQGVLGGEGGLGGKGGLGREGAGARARPSRTKHLRLFGGEGIAVPEAGLEPSTHEHLIGRYGTEADAVRRLAADDPGLAAPLVPGLPYLRAEARYAVQDEMARTLDDVLSRRTRARLLARDASADAAAEVAVLIAPDLGWSDAERDAEVAAYRASIAAERAQLA
jgi:glycerol-3-phosphate dehydrogenase